MSVGQCHGPGVPQPPGKLSPCSAVRSVPRSKGLEMSGRANRLRKTSNSSYGDNGISLPVPTRAHWYRAALVVAACGRGTVGHAGDDAMADPNDSPEKQRGQRGAGPGAKATRGPETPR